MKVYAIKNGTRCAGEIYNIGDPIDCKEIEGEKLIAMGRASKDAPRKAADQKSTIDLDPVSTDDNGE